MNGLWMTDSQVYEKKRNGERDLDEMAMQNRQDWSPLSVEATPTEVPAKQIYFTPV